MSEVTQRYAVRLAYRGTNYAGWQRQPNVMSVEETLDTAMGMMLGLGGPIKLVGCGRTDAGVHAADYVAHFDLPDGTTLPPRLLGRLNRYLPEDLALRGLYRVPEDFHARFHATSRSYVYRIATAKDPFRPDTVTYLPRLNELNRPAMEEAARLLLDYTAFAPFCKTNSDAYTMNCAVSRADWTFGPEEWRFDISANRFLRGMVRLIVGMCVRVGEGRLQLTEVRAALEEQRPLSRPWSAPAAGLYLTDIVYPQTDVWEVVG